MRSHSLLQNVVLPLMLGMLAHSLSATAATQASSASVAYIKGSVQVLSHGVLTEGKVGRPLAREDVLQTGADSAALLMLGDGSRVKLNPETSLAVKMADKGSTELELRGGAIFSKVEKQGTQGHFMIRTKTAVMGVRGTEFYTAFGKKTQEASDVWMCVHEGKVEVESTVGARKVLVKQGEGIFVPAGKAVTPPKKYAWTENLNWNMNPEQGELIDHTRIDYQNLLKQDYD